MLWVPCHRRRFLLLLAAPQRPYNNGTTPIPPPPPPPLPFSVVVPHTRMDHSRAKIALRNPKLLIQGQNLIKGGNGLIELIRQGSIFDKAVVVVLVVVILDHKVLR